MEDEMEMTKEELQKWIRERVKKIGLISPDVLEKCNQLQSLLERREKQAAKILMLCESVTAYEAIVKKQYSLLGWEYRDTDSDDDDNITGCGNIPSSPCESVHSETQASSPPATNGPTPLSPKQQDSADLNGDNGEKRELVVVLTRLPECKIAAALRLPTPQNQYSEHESLSDSDSPKDDSTDSDYAFSSFTSRANKKRKIESETEDDSSDSDSSFSRFISRVNKKRKIESETEDDSSDSDSSFSRFTSRVNKRRKINKNNEKPAKSSVTKISTPQASANTDTKSDASKTSTSQASANTDTRSDTAKTSTSQASANTDTRSDTAKTSTSQASTNADSKSNATKASTPQASANTDAKRNATKTSMPQASANTDSKSNTSGTSTPQGNRNTNAKSNTTKTSPLPANTNASDKATKVPPSVPQEKITVGMNVLARRRAKWQPGKVMGIVNKEDGGFKYKIGFKEKGKTLVSGHHMAFHCMPKVDHLFVGARVVVKCQGDQPQFSPGVLAELPSRKNRMRFLVFLDDHTPMYVALPVLYLMCRTLTDPLDDIPDDIHKNFMKEYIKAWPYPPQTQFKVGSTIKVELNEVQKKCEVLQVDCSLVQVVFQEDKHKEWIYRGSMRLGHMITMREQMS